MPDLNFVQKLVAAVIPVLFAITVHEAAHGYAARYFGDRTAEMLGRLTLNPIKHIDPIGTILVPAIAVLFTGFIFGWAKPVPVGFRNLRNPKRDMIFVAAAGPASNILMAIGWALFASLLARTGLTGGMLGMLLIQMAVFGVLINSILAVFNMLPLPPLDGGRVAVGLLPEPVSSRLASVEPYGFVIILLLLFTGILWPLIGPVISAVQIGVFRLAGLNF